MAWGGGAPPQHAAAVLGIKQGRRLLERGTVLGDGRRRGDIAGVWGVGLGGGGEGDSVGRPLSGGGDPRLDSFLAARGFANSLSVSKSGPYIFTNRRENQKCSKLQVLATLKNENRFY